MYGAGGAGASRASGLVSGTSLSSPGMMCTLITSREPGSWVRAQLERNHPVWARFWFTTMIFPTNKCLESKVSLLQRIGQNLATLPANGRAAPLQVVGFTLQHGTGLQEEIDLPCLKQLIRIASGVVSIYRAMVGVQYELLHVAPTLITLQQFYTSLASICPPTWAHQRGPSQWLRSHLKADSIGIKESSSLKPELPSGQNIQKAWKLKAVSRNTGPN